MEFIFAPAANLLGRLSYKMKFGLIGVLFLLSVGMLTAQLYQRGEESIDLTVAEQRGLTLLDPAMNVLVLMQQHRGLSAGLLGGAEDLRPKVAAKAGEVDAAIAGFDTALAAHALAAVAADWKEIQPAWAELRSGGLALERPDNFARHTVMVQKVLHLIVDIGDASNLSLDPDANSYNLIAPMLGSIPDLTERLGKLRGKGTGLLAAGDLTEADSIALAEQLGALSGTLGLFQSSLLQAANANQAMHADLMGARTDVADAVEKLRHAAAEQLLGRAFQMNPAEFFALGTAAIDTVLRERERLIRPEAGRLLDARLASLTNVLWVQLGLSLSCVLITAYLMIGTYFAMARSVGELSSAAREFAAGNYRAKVVFTARDELSLVAKQFSEMAANTAELIAQIKRGAAELGKASAALATNAQQVATGSEQQSEAASSMAAAVEEMTVGVNEIARNAGEAHERSEHSDKLSREGQEVVGRTVSEIEQIANVVNESAAAVEKLGNQSAEISAMVNSIKEIADQTNLLALNAAIEAARAGETGRGFAVVADEVRKLAERTGRATDEITRMVGAIQGGTGTAVDTMHHGVARVRAGVDLASKAGASMREINDGTRHVVAAVSDISLALREQNAASTDIARNVERIAQMAEENSAAVRQTADTAARLQSLSRELEMQVERFQV
jgi:methyl-accepting chemotaxis protein